MQDVLPHVHIQMARDVGDCRCELMKAVENRTEAVCLHAADVCLPQSFGAHSVVSVRSLRSADLESTVSMRFKSQRTRNNAQGNKGYMPLKSNAASRVSS